MIYLINIGQIFFMTIFSKVDKKVLIILIVVLVAILLVGFMVYQYVAGSNVKVQNLTGGAQTEKKSNNAFGDQNKTATNAPQAQIEIGGVQAQGDTGGGTLSVCLDKCGDGICQKTDSNCGKDNNLNCICPEIPQECPQDCK